MRLSGATAAAIHAPQALAASATIDRDRPLARIGMVVVRPAAQLASLDP